MSTESIPPPLTLRQFAGLPAQPTPLSESVVLVIDAQKEYTEGSLALDDIDTSIEALARFLTRARAANAPIIHIVQVGKPGAKLFATDGPFFEIIDKVKPADGETVIRKSLPSSFKGTTLEEELKKIGKKDLIVTGYMTHMCVNSTTRDAAETGYRCTLAADLTATRDLPDGKGGVIPASAVKAVHLAGLADRFAIIVETANEID